MLSALSIEKLGKKITSAKATAQLVAQTVAHTATQVAKHQLDQAILNLQQSPRVQDALERAERVREQIASRPMSPRWLRDLSLTQFTRRARANAQADDSATEAATEVSAGVDEHGYSFHSTSPDKNEVPASATSISEATVSTAAEEMQPAPMRVVLEDEKATAQMGRAAEREIEEFTEEAGTIIETADVPSSKAAQGEQKKSKRASSSAAKGAMSTASKKHSAKSKKSDASHRAPK